MPVKPNEENVEPYDYRAVLFTYSLIICREVHFIQEVSGVYTSPFLHTDERNMALQA